MSSVSLLFRSQFRVVRENCLKHIQMSSITVKKKIVWWYLRLVVQILFSWRIANFLVWWRIYYFSLLEYIERNNICGFSCTSLIQSATESHRILLETYGDNTQSIKTSKYWFRRFRNADVDKVDKEPKKVEDEELEAILDQESCQRQENL